MNTNNVSLWRSIRGPVMLVTLGTLFLIDHSGGVSFTRTWPVLLIVFGLLTLIGRGARPVAPPPAAPWNPPASAPPPPYDYAAPGGYRQSTYSQPAADASGPAGPAKGGFGSSAPGRSSDPGQTPGGTV